MTNDVQFLLGDGLQDDQSAVLVMTEIGCLAARRVRIHLTQDFITYTPCGMRVSFSIDKCVIYLLI